jgi:hypothetical protein
MRGQTDIRSLDRFEHLIGTPIGAIIFTPIGVGRMQHAWIYKQLENIFALVGRTSMPDGLRILPFFKEVRGPAMLILRLRCSARPVHSVAVRRFQCLTAPLQPFQICAKAKMRIAVRDQTVLIF